MSFLPIDSFLGDLKIVEVYVFYDCPRLFACRNTCGEFFLAVWLEDTEEADLWLYANLSPQRLAAIRTGQIDLYDAFRAAENHWVYQVTTYYEEKVSKIEVVSCDIMEDDWLPERGQYLNRVHPPIELDLTEKHYPLTQLITGTTIIPTTSPMAKNTIEISKERLKQVSITITELFTIGKKQPELKSSNELLSNFIKKLTANDVSVTNLITV